MFNLTLFNVKLIDTVSRANSELFQVILSKKKIVGKICLGNFGWEKLVTTLKFYLLLPAFYSDQVSFFNATYESTKHKPQG